ncbi:hypothetical protein P8831_09885 [Priestia megaterium]|uniref:hypothetical protein n=1 Tax=Priestia megaterium TaxID=1404 RepID=UPI002D7E4250|nr:hypothetical protein [Priestia megaterium]MEB4869025.1 hypothetical protein [Priestia megaterium]
MNTSVRCLYYPYSRALNLNTLKKAVLLFDEIAFVDSKSHSIRNKLISELISKDTKEEIEVSYNMLEEERIVHFLDPSSIVQENDELLMLNILNDISNDDFCKLAIHDTPSIWEVTKERIPPSFLKEFQLDNKAFIQARAVQKVINEQINDRVREEGNFDGNLSDLAIDEVWEQFEDYKYVIGRNRHLYKSSFIHTYMLPFLPASSLRLNEALILCSMNDYIPFTDSRIHDKLLTNKVGRAMEAIEKSPMISEYLEWKLPINLPFQQLSLIVLDKLIPEEELEKRSLEELITYRKDNQDQLKRLREKIMDITTTVNINDVGVNYYGNMERLVNSKIIPEITKTRDEILKKYEEAFGRLTIRSLQTAGATLTTTSFAGMSLAGILIACAVAQTGMLTTVGVNDLVKIWQAKKDMRRHSFSYLTHL